MSSGAGDATPITRYEDLVAHIRSGQKPPEARLVGLEHEKFGYRPGAGPLGEPLDYATGIRPVLDALAERFGWQRRELGGHLLELRRDKASVTLEPGGQLELSGAPAASLDAMARELVAHLDEVLAVSEPAQLRWLLMGARPAGTLDDIDWMPKPRYAIMRRYLPTRGAFAHYMMKMTCTVQVNLDFTSEEDAAQMLRAVLAVTPISSALFATSPFLGGTPSGRTSTRCHFWTDTDPDRTGYLPGMVEPGYTFADYVEYLLDMPMFFVERDGQLHDATHLTFRRYLDQGLDGHRAQLKDWGDHISTAFPEVRLKQYIEVRGADCVPPDLMMAFAALWLGILYDPSTRRQATSLTDGLDFDQRLTLHREMIDHGLAARLPTADRPSLLELARELVALARQGLVALGRPDDRRWLEALEQQVLAPGRSLSRQMRDVYDDTGSLERAIEPMWLTAAQVDAVRTGLRSSDTP